METFIALELTETKAANVDRSIFVIAFDALKCFLEVIDGVLDIGAFIEEFEELYLSETETAKKYRPVWMIVLSKM